MKYLVLLALVSGLIISCGQEHTHSHDATGETTESHDHDGHDHDGHDHDGHDHGDADAQSDGVHFGEVITEDGAAPVGDVLAKFAASEMEEVDVKIVAKVNEVCQAKGCWMSVTDVNNPDAGEMFVQFQDYGFFVPKDLAGSTIVMDGKAYRAVTTVDELKHYAEDAGASKEELDAITEPKEELKFMATGVKIL